MWEEEYRFQGEAADQSCYLLSPQASSPSSRRHYESDSLAQFIALSGFYDQQDVAATRDEYEEYCKTVAKPCEYFLQWWRDHREEYPLLSKMVLDLLSIPLISAECERVFSSAKILITDRRNGLKENIIKTYTLLRWWFKKVNFK